MKLPDSNDIAIEQVKLYREWAYNYFSIRSNITYIDILAAAVITSFFLNHLAKQSGGLISALRKHFALVFAGCAAYFAFSIWASCMCNIFSNSFYQYISMAKHIEISVLHVSYSQVPDGVTEEFLSDSNKDVPVFHTMSGNVWNLVNLSLALYSAYMFVLASLVTKAKFNRLPIWWLAWAAYGLPAALVTRLAFYKFSFWYELGAFVLINFPVVLSWLISRETLRIQFS